MNGRPRATATVRIVDGLYLYGDQAYTPKEWRERERARASERTRKLRRRIVAVAFHRCEAPCPVLTPRPLCFFHSRSAA
jgi:hypothetical protein